MKDAARILVRGDGERRFTDTGVAQQFVVQSEVEDGGGVRISGKRARRMISTKKRIAQQENIRSDRAMTSRHALSRFSATDLTITSHCDLFC